MRMAGLRQRFKEFALRVIRLYTALPRTPEAKVIGNQMLRSGTGAGANQREASRARSDAEFVAKLGIVEQELDETIYWLELLVEAGIMPLERLTDLQNEADELLRITVKSIQSTKNRKMR